MVWLRLLFFLLLFLWQRVQNVLGLHRIFCARIDGHQILRGFSASLVSPVN